MGDQTVGEPNTKYLVGFGRNPFGRFSLTASLNEITGAECRDGNELSSP